MRPFNRKRAADERGQILIIVAGGLVAIMLGVGLVIDSGYALMQHRVAQNAADSAAIAGTRIVTLHYQSGAGTDADVLEAVEETSLANEVGAGEFEAMYVDNKGDPFSPEIAVGGGVIPPSAGGVKVTSAKDFETFFMGLAGFDEMTAHASGTARAAVYAGTLGGPGSPLLPIAVNLATIQGEGVCPVGSDPGDPGCPELELADGHNEPDGLAGPGNFGWMAWPGISGSAPDLASMLRYPSAPSTHLAPVMTVPQNTSITLPGNTGVSNSIAIRTQIANWAASGQTVYVPIISPGPGPCPDGCYPGTSTPYPEPFQGNGAGMTYNIIGFAGFQITGCGSPCVKELHGVFREVVVLGPTGLGLGTPGTEGSILSVQLVK